MPAADNHGWSGTWLDDCHDAAAHNLDRSTEMSIEPMNAPAIDMRAITTMGINAKLDALMEMVEEVVADGHRVLVFSR